MKHFICMLFLFYGTINWSQKTLQLKGTVVDENHSALGFVTVELKDSLGKIVASGYSSEDDGSFLFDFFPTSNYFQLEVKTDCYNQQTYTILSNVDLVPLYIILQHEPCPTTKSSDCPEHSNSCAVIPVQHYDPIFRPTHKQWRADKNGKLKLLRYSGCCEKQWFCSTHQLAF